MSQTQPHQHQPHDDHHHFNPFAVALFITIIFAALEFFGGLYAHSLTLISDAGHMLSDAVALGLAWFASHYAKNAQAKKHASGLTHIEIYASIINCLLMLGVTIYIVLEAIQRLKNPQAVAGFYVMLLAFIGLLVNVFVAKILHHHCTDHGGNDNLNHRAAFLHVLGDLLASVAVLIAGASIYFTGWLAADAILSLIISAFILFSTVQLAKDIWRTLQAK